jgi:uncharacterized membrane protein
VVHETHFLSRALAIALSVASAASMLYIGFYQTRVVGRLWCPLFWQGCETVADAPFARPHGVPDGYIGAVLYGLILTLLLVPPGRHWAWPALMALGVFATYANVKGVYDTAKLGAFCTYCVFVTITAPLLLWLIWRLRW